MWVRRLESARARQLALYPSSLAACRTRASVSGDTRALELAKLLLRITLTVVFETPHLRATSAMVGLAIDWIIRLIPLPLRCSSSALFEMTTNRFIIPDKPVRHQATFT